MGDAAGEELASTVRSTLEYKGVLQGIKAKLRASIYHILEDKTVGAPSEKPVDLILASELVREFLMHMDYSNTLSVFIDESGHPAQMYVDRNAVGGELGIDISGNEDNEDVPLLVLLVQYMKRMKEKYENELYSSLLGTLSLT